MKTFNYKYSDNKDLLEFIKTLNIEKSENILVQIFTGICDVEFIQTLTSSISKTLPQSKIIGCTTSGEIVDGAIYELSTIISFSIFDNTQIITHFQELTDDSYESANKLISKFDSTKRAKVAISFSDGLNTNGEVYINAFENYNKELIVAGGLAGDNVTFNGTVVFTEDKVLTKGCVVALLYNDNLIAHTAANFGWQNIGKKLRISKAKDNIVYEIDGIKAVDIYAKYLGTEIANELPKAGIEFPLIIKRDGLDIPRAVLGKNSDGSLAFAGNFHVGDNVTFGYGNIASIIDGGKKSC